MADKVVNKFKIGVSGATINVVAESSNFAHSASVATVAVGLADTISNYPLTLGAQTGSVNINTKGNVTLESFSKHVNIEAKQSIQLKPTNKIIFDTGRREDATGDNEGIIEVQNDDNKDWASFKINSRNLDLRCHDHGGIALQIAGEDKTNFENKVKFESDRITPIGATKEYCGEGGKGLEFGTFNNEHTSLYTGDYRFKGDAMVYGVTRYAPEPSGSGKIDYPTQSDDFKDVIDINTPKATWNDIISAATVCKRLDETVQVKVAEAVVSGQVDPSIFDVFVTRSEVDDVVASAISEAHIDLTGYAKEQRVLDQHYVNSLPDTLQYLKMGKTKGNFAIDVKGKYTYELTGPKSATTVDEFGNLHERGDRVINYSNEDFYLNPRKVYYKAGMETYFADGTSAHTDDIVYTPECNLHFNLPEGAYNAHEMESDSTSFYEDPTKFLYKGTRNVSIKYGETTPIKKKETIDPSTLSPEEIAYYESQVPVYDEDGKLIAGWEKTPAWTKTTLWTQNEININLETDSKIKFDGKKIETVWSYDDVDHKMDDILLATNTLSTDANEVIFEQKISKNGDRSGQDTELVYSFSNNVADPEKVADVEAFKTNYREKHKGTTKTDAELEAMYDAFLAEGPSYEVRVKISTLLGLVARVEALEARLATLEGENN